MKQKRCRLQPVIRTSHSPGKSYHPYFPQVCQGSWHVVAAPGGTPWGVSSCYHAATRTPRYQEHPGAPSVTANPRVFVRIGPLGYAQVGPGTNYESVGQRLESSWAHHQINCLAHLQFCQPFLGAYRVRLGASCRAGPQRPCWLPGSAARTRLPSS